MHPLIERLDGIKGTLICIILVVIDTVVSFLQVSNAFYDTASPYALSPSLPMALTLKTDTLQWSIVRTLFFSISMALRVVFLIEVALRISLQGPNKYFKNFENVFDTLVVLGMLIMKPLAPARESLLLSPMITLRLNKCLHLIKLIKAKSAIRHRTELAELNEKYANSLTREQEKVKRVREKFRDASEKIRLLTGEEMFLDSAEY